MHITSVQSTGYETVMDTKQNTRLICLFAGVFHLGFTKRLFLYYGCGRQNKFPPKDACDLTPQPVMIFIVKGMIVMDLEIKRESWLI